MIRQSRRTQTLAKAALIALAVLGAGPALAQGLQFAPRAPGSSAPAPQAPQAGKAVNLDLDYTAEHGAWTTQCFSGEGTPDLDRCSIFPPLEGAEGRLGFLILEDPDGGLLTQIRIGLAEGPIDPTAPIRFAFDDGEPIDLFDGFRVISPRLVVIGDAERLGALGTRMGEASTEPGSTVEVTVYRAGGADAAVLTLPLDGFGEAVGALFDHVRDTMAAASGALEPGAPANDGADGFGQ